MKTTFLIPTLNRNGLVQRAVRSCLVALDHARADGEVIVLDSESDDGSWEGLQQEFGEEPRVVLRQNRRGLGPTKSWLDCAEGLTGDAVTFVWSDDYIAPDFLPQLLPPLERGAPVAIGHGAVRPAESEEPFEPDGRVSTMPARQIAAHYCTKSQPDGIHLPVSPTAALFRRDAFDAWFAEVEAISTADSLRAHFMWRRAIGPDLLLFLIALGRSPSVQVPFVHQPVAQFSAHNDSITVSTSSWHLTMGYWLARSAFLRKADRLDTLGEPGKTLGHAILQGDWLAIRAEAPVGDLRTKAAVRAAISAENAALRKMAKGRGGALAVASGMAQGSISRLRGKL
ncbi:glycosyltransferase family 2 protein [Alteriqipengyuania flavescens]|uniref:glycosyltransferase family 2 protein n=1 Tax=Alteriqipengyuania flavescens TaxID=3053610 RepID=UPI0025B44839|nr:glycosyltransferase family 2 protein [Alteriqipengyuania flavescens]WJY18854.1 glycosyltransferase family 2 protein [Alteriqipengyuania flavescens]WJY24794.1 glycosyltransferase family 2 protein [Alteriqipengyuania flavescens]